MSFWKVLKTKELFKTGFFRMRVEECELPDRRVMPAYYIFDFADWVNVVPVTSDGRVILVEQYRHAAGAEFLEIPGGSMHGHGEDARLAGERELREETGYASSEWIDCGGHFPNPALQSNRMHTFLALNCVLVGEPELDPFEDLRVRVMPVREVFKLWEQGGFTHSIISASLARVWPELRKRRLL